MAMMAAALIPLMAMVGGAVDISRVQMVKTRLQQACDAGVLAGRKAVGDGTFDNDAKSRSASFFKANFPTGYQGTSNTSFSPYSNNGGTTVQATASTNIPYVIMDKVYSITGSKAATKKAVTVNCDAKMEVGNSDIMMVLDTTGSMDYSISNGSGGTTTRMASLKAAMKSFNSTLAAAASGTNARIRYGFVPYSGTVNTGKLIYDLNRDYLIGANNLETYNYQSRRAVYKIQTGTSTNSWVETLDPTRWDDYTTSSNCTRFGNNQSTPYIYYSTSYSSTFNPSPSGNPVTSGDTTTTYSYNSWGSPNYNSTYRTCKRNVTQTVKTYTETYNGDLPTATFSHYEYSQVGWPIRSYINTIGSNSATVNVPSEKKGDNIPSRWAGCIEERDTTQTSNPAYNGSSKKITPSSAYDLDIDSAPTNFATKWRPYWPEVTYYRSSGTSSSTSGTKSQTACPQKAQLLSTMSTSAFNTYADSLYSDGGTYHDIGAIWGARLASPDGIFATNVNEAAGNGGYVSRHLIFMTDGQLDTGATYYSAYGVERHDGRVTNDVNNQTERHISRFRAVCDAIKAKGIRLWVIAFATSLNSDMTACASPDSAFVSSDSATLNATFVQIAQSIADLRLSK
ncbi:hypothetical protein LPB140_07950 [Sphingorhabdus lutea]|uniref:Putative Flp pilus-assembly TadG-like N-terminal domain-containing protein n=2 Tax=Sphingorhabdus lutea TaxID=1913578 RepID=A0A1L3JF11_9SPHN|nr:hypothetical protein LPB140_07950 [Sphingorhabdus lutea]